MKHEIEIEINDIPASPMDDNPLLELNSVPWYYSQNSILVSTSAALFIDVLSYSIIFPILPEYITEVYHLSPDYLGILFGSYAFGLLIFTPVFGFLSDYYQNRKVFMLFGYIGLILSSVFFMYGTNFTHLLIARFLAGASSASSWTVGLSAIGAIATDNLSSLIGKVLGWNFLGFFLGPTIGGILYEFYGYNSVFIFIIVLSSLAFIQRAMVSEDYLIQLKKRWLMASEENFMEIESFASLLQRPNVQLGIALTIINGSVISGFEPLLPLYLNDQFHLNPSHVGLIFMVFGIPSILFSTVVGNLAGKYGNYKIMAIGLLSSSLANVLVGQMTILWLEIVALFYMGASNCFALTPLASTIGKSTQAHGKVYALYNGSWAMGMFIGPSIATFIYGSHGFATIMLLFGAVVFTNFLAITIFRKAIQ